MKKKVVVISDKVAFYKRFSTEEKADAFKDKYLILHESEAKDLFKQLKSILFKNEKIPKLLKEGVDNNGIF